MQGYTNIYYYLSKGFPYNTLPERIYRTTQSSMDPIVLTDPAVVPDEELVFERIGTKRLYWKQIAEHIYTHHKEITEAWQFYNDGKCWMFRYLKRKKAICWIGVLEDTFRVGFWLSDKARPLIEQSDLSEAVKESYHNARQTKIGCGFSIVVNESCDVENVLKMIELKLRIK